ncbi:MAG: mrcA [candidate division NC10 bacterium]|nr:mrcA [candidate division NC10 bacterium]
MIVGLCLAAGLVVAFRQDLPNLAQLGEYQPRVATILYTDQGETFHAFFEERRILVPLARIPAQLIQAVLAVEDAQFYEHRGVSPRAIVRALVANVFAGRKAQGGSTITQQLARRLFLTPEKSFARKIRGALLALEIESHYSKERILELYLNEMYFGHGAYGVEAAAQTYFQKSVGDLSLAEAAMLAGLPSAPNRFSPIVDPQRARRRRDHVLTQMVDRQFITRDQAAAATLTPFDETRFTRATTVAPYFVEHVRQHLEKTYGAYALYNSGLKVYTTLNPTLQRAAKEALVGGLRTLEKRRGYRRVGRSEATRGRIGLYTPKRGEVLSGAVRKVNSTSLDVQVGRFRGEIPFRTIKWTRLADPAAAFTEGGSVRVHVLSVDEANKTVGLALEQDPELEGAFLALNLRHGSIQAMIGGYDFERSKFNRATQAKRQPGSAFKPVIYAAAFDTGFTPSTIFDDSPISFETTIDGEEVEWAPQNFDRQFHGPTTLRRALENSVNVVAVKLLDVVGVGRVIEMARQLGIRSPLRRELALALGVSEVTPLELVSAFGVFANGGVRAEPFAIRAVGDSQGHILEQHAPDLRQVMRPEAAFVMVNVMKGVIQRGTGVRAKVLQRPLAGKTGTSADATDVWFVGGTPSLVAGIWLGYDLKRSLGPVETGSRLALPIWIAFMKKALAGTEPGLPAPFGASEAITEYFVKGTEPDEMLRMPTPPVTGG